jgi:hypothetical protein
LWIVAAVAETVGNMPGSRRTKIAAEEDEEETRLVAAVLANEKAYLHANTRPQNLPFS